MKKKKQIDDLEKRVSALESERKSRKSATKTLGKLVRDQKATSQKVKKLQKKAKDGNV